MHCGQVLCHGLLLRLRKPWPWCVCNRRLRVYFCLYNGRWCLLCTALPLVLREAGATPSLTSARALTSQRVHRGAEVLYGLSMPRLLRLCVPLPEGRRGTRPALPCLRSVIVPVPQLSVGRTRGQDGTQARVSWLRSGLGGALHLTLGGEVCLFAFCREACNLCPWL